MPGHEHVWVDRTPVTSFRLDIQKSDPGHEKAVSYELSGHRSRSQCMAITEWVVHRGSHACRDATGGAVQRAALRAHDARARQPGYVPGDKDRRMASQRRARTWRWCWCNVRDNWTEIVWEVIRRSARRP